MHVAASTFHPKTPSIIHITKTENSFSALEVAAIWLGSDFLGVLMRSLWGFDPFGANWSGSDFLGF